MDKIDSEIIKVRNDIVSIRKRKKNKEKVNEIKITDDLLTPLTLLIKELIESINVLNGDWIANDNVYLVNIIRECIKILNKYKYLIIEDKKKLILIIIKKIFDKELKKTDEVSNEIKNKLLQGIDEIIEPSLELAIRTLNGEIGVNKNCLLGIIQCLPRN